SIYAREGSGIAVRTTYDRLVRSITPDRREMYIGVVRYIDYDTEPIDESNHLAPFVHKRLSFAHEHELRVVVASSQHVPHGSSHTWPETSEYVRAELSTLIEDVNIAPLSPAWFREIVQSVTGKYGLDVKVRRSAMDRAPFI
ncbi:MAG: hypothetical protein WD400_01735, partial [Pontimonas sp.]